MQLMPYKFDGSHLYYHSFANWAVAAARSMLVWHNTVAWHTSPGEPPTLAATLHGRQAQLGGPPPRSSRSSSRSGSSTACLFLHGVPHPLHVARRLLVISSFHKYAVSLRTALHEQSRTTGCLVGGSPREEAAALPILRHSRLSRCCRAGAGGRLQEPRHEGAGGSGGRPRRRGRHGARGAGRPPRAPRAAAAQ